MFKTHLINNKLYVPTISTYYVVPIQIYTIIIVMVVLLQLLLHQSEEVVFYT